MKMVTTIYLNGWRYLWMDVSGTVALFIPRVRSRMPGFGQKSGMHMARDRLVRRTLRGLRAHTHSVFVPLSPFSLEVRLSPATPELFPPNRASFCQVPRLLCLSQCDPFPAVSPTSRDRSATPVAPPPAIHVPRNTASARVPRPAPSLPDCCADTPAFVASLHRPRWPADDIPPARPGGCWRFCEPRGSRRAG